MNGDTLAAVLQSAGLNADNLEGQIDGILADKRFKKAPGRLARAILDAFGDQLGSVTAADRSDIADTLQNAIMGGMSEVDIPGFLEAMNAKGAGVADFAEIFGLNHASKMQALLPHLYREFLAKAQNAEGTAKRMREKQMFGIIGEINELTAAFDAFFVAVGNSGLLADASRAMNAMSSSVTRLADSNPDLLRFGAYAALTLAAMAPLGLVLSGAASALALMVNPLSWVVAGLGYLATVNFDALTTFFGALGDVFTDRLNPEILERASAAFDGMGSA